jgi:hypothetical protein
LDQVQNDREDGNEGEKWGERGDLNPQPPAPQAGSVATQRFSAPPSPTIFG